MDSNTPIIGLFMATVRLNHTASKMCKQHNPNKPFTEVWPIAGLLYVYQQSYCYPASAGGGRGEKPAGGGRGGGGGGERNEPRRK